MEKKKITDFFHRNQVIIIGIIMVIVFAVSMKIAYKYEWKNAFNTPKIVENKVDSAEKNMELKEDTLIEQSVKIESDKMTGISLYLGNLDVSCKKIRFTLKNSKNEIVKEWQIRRGANGEESYDFTLDKEVKNAKDKEYTFEIQFDSKGTIMVPLCKKGNSKTVLKVNGVKKNNLIIGYKILDGNHKGLRYFAFSVMCGAILCLVMVLYQIVQKKEKAVIFITAALVLGAMYICVIPAFAVPDEAAHFATTYAQSSTLMGKKAVDEKGNILIEQQIWQRGNDATKVSYLDEVNGVFVRGNNSPIIATRPELSGVYLGYIPQVVGVTIARICGAGPIQIILSGRFFALLFYCLCMFYAIRLMPNNEQILMIIGLFPMTLQQVMSYSYDSILIDASFLLTAIIMSKIVDKKKIKKREVLLVLFLIAIIGTLKFIYLPILMLALFIPSKVFGNKKGIYALGTIAFSAVIVLVTRLASVQDALGTGDAVISNEVGKISLGYCLHNPTHTFELLWRTIERVSSDYLGQMISTQLGYLCINTPNIILIGFIILLIGSALRVEKQEKLFNVKIRRMSIAIFILCGGLVIVSLMFSWTPLDSMVIQGVQGRYFLPVLPMVGIAIQSRTIVLKKDITSYLILWSVFLNIYTIYFATLSALGK